MTHDLSRRFSSQSHTRVDITSGESAPSYTYCDAAAYDVSNSWTTSGTVPVRVR